MTACASKFISFSSFSFYGCELVRVCACVCVCVCVPVEVAAVRVRVYTPRIARVAFAS